VRDLTFYQQLVIILHKNLDTEKAGGATQKDFVNAGFDDRLREAQKKGEDLIRQRQEEMAKELEKNNFTVV
jgi:hypothetical protein